jgi:hypothetical protein
MVATLRRAVRRTIHTHKIQPFSSSTLGQLGGVERAGPGEISFEYSGRNLALQRNECSSAPESIAPCLVLVTPLRIPHE